jgi:DNA polymerase delta subunit 1
VANGWPGDAQTLYGDTDSVMVRFGGSCQTVAEAFQWGIKLEALLNEQFIVPIEMEMEKVYYPWLLFNKKRYAGVMYKDARNPDKINKIDVKGIESKRRDNCLLTSQTQKRALDLLLIDKDKEKAEEVLRDVVRRLLKNEVDMSQLVITKEYARSEYKTKAAHVELVKRIKKRDPGAVPKLGDRVPFVMVRAGKKAPGYEKSEDPLYAMEHGVPVDDDWYLEKQLKKPMELVYVPLLGEKRTHELFYGEHTRKRVKPTPNKALGGIMQFAVKKATCASCHAVIHNAKDAVHHVQCEDARPLVFRCSMQAVVQAMEPAGSADKQLPVLCVHCAQKSNVVHAQERKVQQLAQEFHQCWSYCQTCQEERHTELVCTAVSCPIFYKRVKVARDWEQQRERLHAMHAFDW